MDGWKRWKGRPFVEINLIQSSSVVSFSEFEPIPKLSKEVLGWRSVH